MTNLQLVFSDLYNDASKFLGTYGTSGPSGTDLTDAKDCVHHGYRRFLNAHDWTFLRRYGRLITVSGTWEYELPPDFSEIIYTFTFNAGDAYPPVEQRSVQQIYDMRSISDYSSYPEYFAIRPGKYTKETGQLWEVIFYPTADAAHTLHYGYKIYPEKLSDDNDIPIGSADISDLIRQYIIAEAELFRDEIRGPQNDKIRELLSDAIKKDNRKKSKLLGQMLKGIPDSSIRDVHRSTRLNDVDYDTSS